MLPQARSHSSPRELRAAVVRGKAVRNDVPGRLTHRRRSTLQVVVGEQLNTDSIHQAGADSGTPCFATSVSGACLAVTINTAALAKHHGVEALSMPPDAPQWVLECRGNQVAALTLQPCHIAIVFVDISSIRSFELAV